MHSRTQPLTLSQGPNPAPYHMVKPAGMPLGLMPMELPAPAPPAFFSFFSTMIACACSEHIQLARTMQACQVSMTEVRRTAQIVDTLSSPRAATSAATLHTALLMSTACSCPVLLLHPTWPCHLPHATCLRIPTLSCTKACSMQLHAEDASCSDVASIQPPSHSKARAHMLKQASRHSVLPSNHIVPGHAARQLLTRISKESAQQDQQGQSDATC